MAKRTRENTNKEEERNFDAEENLTLDENLLATENQSHNIKKEALGPNTKR
ncbi:MAG: hypothetical protein AAGU27_24250 [Dehalobacterium sp.]